MPLPTDNETEGVIITAAPMVGVGGLVSPTLNSPLVVAAPPATTIAPYFLPFRKVLRERWLWLTCGLALLIFVFAYQFFPNYHYNVILDDGGGPSYSKPALRLDYGWQPLAQYVQSPYTLGLRTTKVGSIYLPNFGYSIGTGTYALQVDALATRPISFTVSVGDQLIGTYAAQNQVYKAIISIPASAFLAAGPHPSIIFAITRFAPASAGSMEPRLILDDFDLRAPSAIVIDIPPVLVLLCVLLTALLCGLEVRRSYSPSQSAFRVTGINLAIFISLLFIWLHPLQRLDLLSSLLWAILFLGAAFVITWRRELANWILHLRHPGDDRFIVR